MSQHALVKVRQQPASVDQLLHADQQHTSKFRGSIETRDKAVKVASESRVASPSPVIDVSLHAVRTKLLF